MKHPYHIVDYSPWPFTCSVGALFLTTGTARWFNNHGQGLMIMGGCIILVTLYQWWRDVGREGTFQGKHSLAVENGLRLGFILFIVSEIFFFFSFFWAFFHNSLSRPWPPAGIKAVPPFGVPLYNTFILLFSGVTVTMAHLALLRGWVSVASLALFLTVELGVLFSQKQYYEYLHCSFTIADSVFGRTFFLTTGFHGLHVLIGTAFLFVIFVRHLKGYHSRSHHFGFEASAWYWHFVDVVWLFLFFSMYWWGS